MRTILNGPVLGTAGVGKFHDGVDPAGKAACTTLNVIGWIPCASLVSGAVRTVVGLRILSNSQGRSKQTLAKTWITRGISEMCGLGFMLAPIDIGCTAARCVRKKHDKKVYISAASK